MTKFFIIIFLFVLTLLIISFSQGGVAILLSIAIPISLLTYLPFYPRLVMAFLWGFFSELYLLIPFGSLLTVLVIVSFLIEIFEAFFAGNTWQSKTFESIVLFLAAIPIFFLAALVLARLQSIKFIIPGYFTSHYLIYFLAGIFVVLPAISYLNFILFFKKT